MEIFKEISLNSEYEISNCGNVRRNRKPSPAKYNKRKKPDCYPIKPNLTTSGYYSFQAHQKPYSIHRMVAEKFIPNPEMKSQVNHKDGNKLNNHVSNLEWATPKENLDHALKNGLVKTGSKSKCSKIILDFQTGIYYGCTQDAADVFGMNRNTLAGKLSGQDRNNTSLQYV